MSESADPIQKYDQTSGPMDLLARKLSDAMHPNRPRFDGTVNLGHILQLVAVAAAMVTIYVNGEVRASRIDGRVTTLEASQVEMRAAMKNMTEAQTAIARSQERMSAAIEWFVRPQAQPPRTP